MSLFKNIPLTSFFIEKRGNRENMLKDKKTKEYQEGYAILLIVLILSAASLTVVTSLLIWGFYFNRTSLDLEKSKQALGLADACAETALQHIRDDDTYIGTDTISLGGGSCEYTISGVSPNKTIEAVGTSGTTVRKVQITTNQIDPQIDISSWQEVGDF